MMKLAVALMFVLGACGGTAASGGGGAGEEVAGSSGSGGRSTASDGGAEGDDVNDDGDDANGTATTPGVPIVTFTTEQHASFGLSGQSDAGTPRFTSKADPSTPVDGAASFLVIGIADNSASSCVDSGFGKELDASHAGKRIRMRQKVRSENVTAVNLRLSLIKANKQGGVTDDMETPHDRRIRGTTPWKEIALVLDVPADVDMAVTGLRVCGSGRAWFGPVILEIVPSTVPTTPHITWERW